MSTEMLSRPDHDDSLDYLAGHAIYEFRDVAFRAQLVMGVIAGIGAAAGIGAVRLGLRGQPGYFVVAAVAAVVALAGLGFVYWRFGRPAGLRLTEGGLTLIRGGEESTLPLDELCAFRAQWTDYVINGVYQKTGVRFQFASDQPSSSAWTYDAQATYGAPKFEELQQFQTRMARIVAERMHDELNREGRVSWTDRLTLLSTGLEFRDGKDAEPRVIPFAQVTRWEVDQGLFKLAIDGGSKPNIVEKATQWNFYPGLLLLEQLSA